MSKLHKLGIEDFKNFGKVRSFNANMGMYQPIMKFQKDGTCCSPSQSPCLDTIEIPAEHAAKSIVSINIEGGVGTLDAPVAITDNAGVKDAMCAIVTQMDPQEYNLKNIVVDNEDGTYTLLHVGQLTLTSITLDDDTVLTSTRQCEIVQECRFIIPVAIGGTGLEITDGVGGSDSTVDATDAATLQASLTAALTALGVTFSEVLVEEVEGSAPAQADVTLRAHADFKGELDGVCFTKCECYNCFV